MKMMKKLARISAFITLPFMWGGFGLKLMTLRQVQCYQAYGSSSAIRTAIDEFFDQADKMSTDQLQNRYQTETNANYRNIIEWIAREKGISLEDPDLEAARAASLSVKATLAVLSDPKTPQDELAKLLRKLLRNNEETLTSEDLANVQKKNPDITNLHAFQDVQMAVLIRETAQGETNTAAAQTSETLAVTAHPNPETPATQTANPYLGKSAEELLRMSDGNPALGEDPLFQAALTKAVGEDKAAEVDVEALSQGFPLTTVLKKECDIEIFKAVLASLSLKSPTNDRYEIPNLKSILSANRLTAIKTPGFGNCAFDAALLAWLCREELYQPEWNAVLGKYLEANILEFRTTVYNTAKERGFSFLQQDIEKIKVRYEYVMAETFRAIAATLNSPVILLYTSENNTRVSATLYSVEGTMSSVIEPEHNLNRIMEGNPGALLVAHTGHNHFVALREE